MTDVHASLNEVLSFLGLESVAPSFAASAVNHLRLDSRAIESGDVFIALGGRSSHGLDFAEQAIENGAVAVLHDASANSSDRYFAVPDLADRLQALAAFFYKTDVNCPELYAVTGTNGKTSCASNLAAVLNALGTRAGVIGTLGWGVGGELSDTGMTTPDVLSAHRCVAALRDEGCKAIALEASSHALDQNRLGGLPISHAMFTNLTREHLDYHGSLDAYGQAKALLFQRPELKTAIVNADDDFGRTLPAHTQGDTQVHSYSLSGERAHSIAQGEHADKPDVIASDVRTAANGLSANVHTPWGEGLIQLAQIGRFNLANALAVITAACASDHSLPAVLRTISTLKSVPGRMELIQGGASQATVIVDYAHTPDALSCALSSAREHCTGQLTVVFGCGGDRDRGKRPIMGAIAADLADFSVLTSDNPRSEAPLDIIAELESGLAAQSNTAYVIEADRGKAIERAIARSGPGDLILIAGKGHENYQEINGTRHHFDDRAFARKALRTARAEEASS